MIARFTFHGILQSSLAAFSGMAVIPIVSKSPPSVHTNARHWYYLGNHHGYPACSSGGGGSLSDRFQHPFKTTVTLLVRMVRGVVAVKLHR